MNTKSTDWMKVSEIELLYKTKVKASERPVISQSVDAYRLLLQHWDQHSIELFETFKVMLLNRANHVLGLLTLSNGGTTGTVVDVRLLFTAALKGNAVGIILAHNHPSGNVRPSGADEEVTQKIQHGARLLDIKVLDHLIITRSEYFSFADEGRL